MQSRLQVASLYAFGHGAVLTVLGATETRALGRAGLYLLLLGTLLFAGSLVGGRCCSGRPPWRRSAELA